MIAANDLRYASINTPKSSGSLFRSQDGHAAYAANANKPPSTVFTARAWITSLGATPVIEISSTTSALTVTPKIP